MKQKRIICAALLINDQVVIGLKYNDELMQRHISLIKEPYSAANVVRGFIASDGEFYTAREAWGIAARNGQIKTLTKSQEDGRLLTTTPELEPENIL